MILKKKKGEKCFLFKKQIAKLAYLHIVSFI